MYNTITISYNFALVWRNWIFALFGTCYTDLATAIWTSCTPQLHHVTFVILFILLHHVTSSRYYLLHTVTERQRHAVTSCYRLGVLLCYIMLHRAMILSYIMLHFLFILCYIELHILFVFCYNQLLF